MSKHSICLIIPAYNESEVLDSLLLELCKYPFQIVLVDDGSLDETYSVASKYPIHLLHHVCNLGQGAALQTGITYALHLPEIKVLVTFDADGQHDPKQIIAITDPILSGKVEVVLGSRYLSKGHVVNISFAKTCILKLAIFFTRLTTHLYVTDTHNGFRAFSSESASQIRITQNGMSHASQLLKIIREKKFRYCEVPVTITYTKYSKNKGQSVWNSINILWDSFFGGLK